MKEISSDTSTEVKTDGRKSPKSAVEIQGKKFGRWTVIRREENNARNRTVWLCKCDCGTERKVLGSVLKNGRSRSCGCLTVDVFVKRNTKHGQYKRSEYKTWQAMKTRCCNPKSEAFKEWGGRGISICEHWINNFSNFLADMGTRPSLEYSIDRIDNDKNYSCGHCEQCLANGWTANCRWSTRLEQNTNRRPSRKYKPSKKYKKRTPKTVENKS